MQLKLLALIFSFTILVENQTSALYVSHTEESARTFVQQASSLYFHYLNALKDASFETNEDFFEGINIAVGYREMVNHIAELAKQAKTFLQEHIQDEELRKELELLSNAGLFVLGNDYFDRLLLHVDTLNELSTGEFLCSYDQRDYCELAYIHDVRRVIVQSHNVHELQFYWEQWRNKISPTVREHLKNFTDLFKHAAQLNEKTPLDLWFFEYDDPTIFNFMKLAMEQIKPFYSIFHAYVRHVLNKKYGEVIVGATGPIPHHLIEQVLAQAWKKNSLLEQPYPNKRLPNMKEQLDIYGFNSTKRIVQIGDDFFGSLGFETLPDTFWNNYTRIKNKQEAGDDCKSDVFDHTPDVALKYCPKLNFRRFLQFHGDMARLHYAIQKKDLPAYYFDSSEFEYAVGEATILSASTPKHIQRIGLLPGYIYDEQFNMNRLFRLGIHTIFQIPLHFVHTKIMYEILDDRISFKQINDRYWELMEEHAGIEPPSDRKLDNIDFPYKFYEKLNENHHTRKFVNEILGYQFYRALCNISGEYIPGNLSTPLQNCDFYGSRAAGDALKRMMQLGSKKPWKDVLAEVIQNEKVLSASALLEYYEPLKNWLESQNTINNVEAGWTKSKFTVKYEFH